MLKTAEEMTDDILSSLRMKNAPERVLIEGYIEKCLESAKKEGKLEALKEISKENSK